MFTTFIINLKDDISKRDAMQSQLDNFNLNYQFIDAVKGADLTDEQIKSKVLNYPNSLITKGEIGCALSHLKIYQKMVDENIEYALVLEDDAVLSPNIEESINKIIHQDIKNNKNVYLLSKIDSYIKNKKLHTNIYKIYDASGAHGYLVNLKAASNLLSKLIPIRYEADMWKIFRIRKYANIYCVIPHLIDTNDEDKSNSSLEPERLMNPSGRSDYRIKVYKNESFYQLYRVLENIHKKYIYNIINR